MSTCRLAMCRSLAAVCVVVLQLVPAPAVARQARQTVKKHSKWPTSTETDLRSHLQRASQACEQHDGSAVLDALDQAREVVSIVAPLQLGPLHVLADKPRGQGAYTLAPGAVVRGDMLLLYARVRHFETAKKKGNPGLKVIDIQTDASFFYEDGQHIATQKKIGVHHLEVREVPLETFMVLELKIKGLPAQPYQVELTATDLHGGRAGKARTRFVIGR